MLRFRQNWLYQKILYIHGKTQERRTEKARCVQKRSDDERAASVKRGDNQWLQVHSSGKYYNRAGLRPLVNSYDKSVPRVMKNYILRSRLKKIAPGLAPP